jgi:hypothetical protein
MMLSRILVTGLRTSRNFVNSDVIVSEMGLTAVPITGRTSARIRLIGLKTGSTIEGNVDSNRNYSFLIRTKKPSMDSQRSKVPWCLGHKKGPHEMKAQHFNEGKCGRPSGT